MRAIVFIYSMIFSFSAFSVTYNCVMKANREMKEKVAPPVNLDEIDNGKIIPLFNYTERNSYEHTRQVAPEDATEEYLNSEIFSTTLWKKSKDEVCLQFNGVKVFGLPANIEDKCVKQGENINYGFVTYTVGSPKIECISDVVAEKSKDPVEPEEKLAGPKTPELPVYDDGGAVLDQGESSDPPYGNHN